MTSPLKTSVTSSLHCCSVESVPSSTGGGLFALGMYELNEETGLRKGALALYDRASLVTTRPMTSGVLDMKFHGNLLACAMSSGDVEFLLLDEATGDFQTLGGDSNVSISNPDEGLALSIDWNKRQGNEAQLAVSTQEGSVLVYDSTPSGMLESTTLRNVHSLFGEHIPAWITAFNPHNPVMLLSGGDDCCLKLWDLRCPHSPTHSLAKHFTAGVTSAQWCPRESQEHLFAAGSYDGSIALWDRRMQRQAPLAALVSGGGVWRLKWRPEREGGALAGDEESAMYLGAASMHGGSGIHKVDLGGGEVTLTTVETQVDVNEDRLVYGMDWLGRDNRGGGVEEENTVCGRVETKRSAESSLDYEIATCSFYDNLVQVWSRWGQVM